MKILVTGTSGRIGSAIAKRLKQDMEVIGLDLNAGNFTTVEGNILDRKLLTSLCCDIDGIVHVAALHAPHVGLRPPGDFKAINVEGTRILIEAALKQNIPRFVLTSTTSIYGHSLVPGEEAVWVTEELPPQPHDIYDETKREAEKVCEKASESGITCIVLRMSRCFPEPERDMTIYRLYRGVDERDVAEGHYLALTSAIRGYEVFNISSLPPFEHSEAKALLDDAPSVIKRHFPWSEEEFERRRWSLPDSIDRVYVIDKAKKALGYEPKYNFASLFGREAVL